MLSIWGLEVWRVKLDLAPPAPHSTHASISKCYTGNQDGKQKVVDLGTGSASNQGRQRWELSVTQTSSQCKTDADLCTTELNIGREDRQAITKETCSLREVLHAGRAEKANLGRRSSGKMRTVRNHTR